jgi:hypothetical protein
MRHLLQRHPLPIRAWFRHCLVLAYALPGKVLEPMLPPGLMLDTFEGLGFLAIAMVQTQVLRPAFLPPRFGQDFTLTGYRIFARHRLADGRVLRGLRILRSDANRRNLVWGGNLLTHYRYRRCDAEIREGSAGLAFEITTPDAEADICVRTRPDAPTNSPPVGSPFRDLRQARLFAGPLPFTFDYEKETHSIILIEGVRKDWRPVPVAVQVQRLTFLEQPPFNQAALRLANAFYVGGIAYLWKRGVRHVLAPPP